MNLREVVILSIWTITIFITIIITAQHILVWIDTQKTFKEIPKYKIKIYERSPCINLICFCITLFFCLFKLIYFISGCKNAMPFFDYCKLLAVVSSIIVTLCICINNILNVSISSATIIILPLFYALNSTGLFIYWILLILIAITYILYCNRKLKKV